MTNTPNYRFADIVGIISSSLCLIHCVATPLLIALGASFMANPYIKYLFLIIAFSSIYKATEKTGNSKTGLFLWVAFWGFLFSILFQEEFPSLHYLEYAFAISIIIGHILNRRNCKQCR